jgi:superfamily I DNA/RNA helicase
MTTTEETKVTFTPTAEQQEIQKAFDTGGTLLIEAGAGTGKTTTLKMLARSTSKRILYIAYNKAIQVEASADFPQNVQCRTAHSLAYRSHAIPFKHRLNGPRVTAKDAAKVLDITEGFGDEDSYLSPVQIARIALDTVRRFCYSADDEINKRHVPQQPGTEAYSDSFKDTVVKHARKAWADINDKNGKLKFEHDHYLKMWALSKPKLNVEVVMLDEAQDANPVIAQVVNAQTHAQRIMVGDRNQAIYGWRGAVDAMSTFPADHVCYLQKSFRFGPAVAEEANKWLTLLSAELRIIGHDPIPSVIEPLEDLPKGAAVLCRTNAEVITQAMREQAKGNRVAIVGGANEIKKYAEAAIDLMSGKRTWHPELCAFPNWGAVQEYCRTEADAAGTMKMIVRLIDTYGPEAIIQVADSCVDESKADIIVSTSHKAKGREWDHVRIGNDFQPRTEDGKEVPPSRPEMMLAYVAVTRAKITLDNEGLAWVSKLFATVELTEA